MIRPYTKKEEKLLREGLKQTEPFLLTKEMLVKKDKTVALLLVLNVVVILLCMIMIGS